jgi:methionine--tRNA ligase beta chain
MISWEDFAKLDMRIGEVLAAEVPEGSRSLIQLRVNFGAELGERQILAGVKAWYTPEELIGKQLPFLVNLEPKKMGKLGESQGMLLAAAPKDAEGRERAVLIEVTSVVEPGTRLR